MGYYYSKISRAPSFSHQSHVKYPQSSFLLCSKRDLKSHKCFQFLWENLTFIELKKF